VGKYVLMSLTSSICSPISLITLRSILISNVGWEETGYWQSAFRISEVYLSIVTVTLSAYYFPRIALIKDYESLKKYVRLNLYITIPITTLMAILIYFLRVDILKIAFSNDFIEAENLFLVQLIGDVLKIAGFTLAYVMISRCSYRLYISSEIFFSTLFVFFGHIFIKEYGVHGANIAYLVNYLIYFIFMSLGFKYIVGKNEK
jgi:PST family polysaccharide transporter